MQVQSFHPQDLYYIKYHVCLPQFFFIFLELLYPASGTFLSNFFDPDIEIMLESVQYFLSVITIQKLNGLTARGFPLLTIY